MLIKGERQLEVKDIQWDTGSDLSLLSISLAARLGVNLREGRPLELRGIGGGVVRGWLHEMLMMVVSGDKCLSKDGKECYIFQESVLFADVDERIRLLGRGVDNKLDIEIGKEGITVTVRPEAPPSIKGPIPKRPLLDLLPKEVLGYKLAEFDISSSIWLLEREGIRVEGATAVRGEKKSSVSIGQSDVDHLEIGVYDLASPRDAQFALTILKDIFGFARPGQLGICRCKASPENIVCTIDYWDGGDELVDKVQASFVINYQQIWIFGPSEPRPRCSADLPSQWTYYGSMAWTMEDLAFYIHLYKQYGKEAFDDFYKELQEISKIVITKAASTKSR